MSKKGGATLQKDVSWRASLNGGEPIPKIHHSPLLHLQQNPNSNYALAIMKHPDPIGKGFASEATFKLLVLIVLFLVRLLPLDYLVWPIEINMKFMEPVDKELKTVGKFMDSDLNLMNASFQDR
ncbi:hypothetical protein MKX01_036197 [Papaver californicum]|nr:hypothetical protein MKX01_036197 [Papaver californicum]